MTFVQEPSKLAHSLARRQGDLGGPNFVHSYAQEGADQAGSPFADPHALLAANKLPELDLEITSEDRALWVFMKPKARPSFTPQLLSDLATMRELIASMLAVAPADQPPFDYFVLGSRADGVFNLGGDLPLFAEKIRNQDREALRRYAYSCVETGYAVYTGYDNRVVSIALLQGDALGGGLESALYCDVLIAERQAKFGLPEVLFNLFPGMGAYSLLSRRVGQVRAEEMILSGRTYSAEEMLALGAIDVVADTGKGRETVCDYIARNRTRRSAQAALYKVRRRVNPVSLAELKDVTDLWVEAAMALSEQDLRRMCRIAAAQDRFRARNQAGRSAPSA